VAARRRILIEQRAFSSDRYAVESQIRLHGLDPDEVLLQIGPRTGETGIRTEDVCTLLEREGSHIATVLLSGVQYLSGQLFDMATIAACARRQGCVIGFDLAHAIGNVPLQLHDWNADFAVWCSYKYLNGGPGAIGGCFVHERHARAFDLPRLAGWWGHDAGTRFAMPDAFRPQPGAPGWQVSNMPILSAAPLLTSLELFEAAGMEALRAKSLRLTGYFESQLRTCLGEAVTILTPAEPLARGCQLSLRLRRSAEQARAVYSALLRDGFVCDWREPDVIRVAPVPLYNTFSEVQQFVAALAREMG
jgi:kynureninase